MPIVPGTESGFKDFGILIPPDPLRPPAVAVAYRRCDSGLCLILSLSWADTVSERGNQQDEDHGNDGEPVQVKHCLSRYLVLFELGGKRRAAVATNLAPGANFVAATMATRAVPSRFQVYSPFTSASE